MPFVMFTGLVLLVLTLSGLIFARIVVFPKRFGVLETYTFEKEKGLLDDAEYQSWPKEEVLIQSDFGYSLYGLYFPSEGSKKAVILSHGITYTLYGSVKYMKVFRELGFNTFIYDLRHHGQSGGKNTTFGLFEKHDLARVMDWVAQRIGPGAVIGTHGESLGAAISMQHAAIDPRVAFVVEDCGFSNLAELLAYRLKAEYHLGKFPILYLASFFSQLLTRMRFEQVMPIQAIEQITAPVLFIHGAADDYIPPQMAQALYQKKQIGARGLYLAPEAGHAESYRSDRAAYTQVVTDFLRVNQLM